MLGYELSLSNIAVGLSFLIFAAWLIFGSMYYFLIAPTYSDSRITSIIQFIMVSTLGSFVLIFNSERRDEFKDEFNYRLRKRKRKIKEFISRIKARVEKSFDKAGNKFSNWWNRKEIQAKKATEALVLEAKQTQEKQRKLWEQQNPVTLFYNVMDGYIAVLNERTYKKLLSRHKQHVKDKIRTASSPLDLTQDYVVYTSRDIIDEQYRFFIAGTLTDFDELWEKANLQKKGHIFVPFCNETHNTFEKQRKILTTKYDNNGTEYRENKPKTAETFLLRRVWAEYPENLR